MRLVWTAALLGLVGAALTGCSGGTPGTARLARLEVTHPNVSIAAGRTESFKASAIYDDGSTQDVTASVSWSSSLPWVATIAPSGLATSWHQGRAEIRARLGELTGAATLEVTEPVADSVRVEPTDRSIPTNANVQFAAYAILSDGTERAVTGLSTWSSRDPNFATVSSSGVVTGQVPGTARIVAAFGGVEGETPVIVVPSILFAGGDALAALAYVGSSWFNPNEPTQSRRLSNSSNPPDTGSIFGAFSAEDSGVGVPNPQISYCQSGDGVGKAVFVGLDGARGDDECGDYSMQPQGFSGVLRGGGAPTDPDFVGAELPMNGEEYIRFLENKGARGGGATQTRPVQIPALAASIAIPYNNPDVAAWNAANRGDPTLPLGLTSAQLCGIFSGAITDWSELDQFDPRLPARLIRVVYRGDRSAATFALTNHMSFLQSAGRQCAGFTFSTTPLFVRAVPTTLPPDAVPAGSNAGLGAAIADPQMPSTIGYIGYGEAADLRLRFPGLPLARVNGFDPLCRTGTTGCSAGLQPPLITTYASSCVIEPRSENVNMNNCAGAGPGEVGRPAIGSPDLNTNRANPCLDLVDPDTYADPSSAPATPGYPILSVSYLLAYSAGNGTAAPAIQRALLAPSQATELPAGFVSLGGYAPPTNCVGQ